MSSEQPTGATHKRWWPIAAVVLLLGVGGSFWALGRSPVDREKPADDRASITTAAATPTAYVPPSSEGYLGSAKCAECHAEIAETYKTHPMAHSIVRVESVLDGDLARADMRVDGKQWVYDVEIADGGMRHHEKMFDADGQLIYDQAVPMHYVVGSGRQGMAFLHQRGETLFMSPLNWYTKQARWGMAPGYSLEDQRRFDRRITEECLACHAGRLAVAQRLVDRFQPQPFHEMSVGCENCHGPGAEHVAFRQNPVSDDSADPIVNPAKLDHSKREAVCNQCHLQATVRLTRPGRSDADFRPGQELEEIWTLLDTGDQVGKDGKSSAVSHVQQMRASRCYKESDGRMGCTSCHDPHRLPSESEQAAFYRERCLNCHTDSSCSAPREQRQAAADSCIACHMPRQKTANIAHLTQSDHRVIRKAGESQKVDSDKATDDETLAFFDGTQVRLSEWERDRALGVGAWLHLSKKGRPRPIELAQFLDGVIKKGPPDGEMLTILGAMALDANRLDLARGYEEQAKVLPEAEEAALTGLMKVHYLSGEPQEALKCTDRLLELDPGHARAHAVRAEVLGALGRPSEGVEAALKALEFNPTLVPVRQWLAEAYRALGRTREQHEQEAIIERMKEARPPSR